MDIKFKKGILNKQIDQLIKYSLTDEVIGKFTSDKERFKNKEAFLEWKNKGREIFTLTNKNNDLLGIIWFGFKELPKRDYREEIDLKNYKISFAIRIYGEARGKGLALDFMKKSLKMKGIWLEVSDGNLAAKNLYTKFGFRQVSSVDKNNKIIMVF
jgi:RimJ/RimL family protein N-acetyltransferase